MEQSYHFSSSMEVNRTYSDLGHVHQDIQPPVVWVKKPSDVSKPWLWDFEAFWDPKQPISCLTSRSENGCLVALSFAVTCHKS